MYNDPEVQVGAGGILAPRQIGYRELLEQWVKTNPLNAVVVHSETGEFVGHAYFRDGESQREYTLGLAITRKFRGKGFGREVVAWMVQHGFRMMGIHRISLGVFESNTRGLAAYKATGFVHEGVKRKARFIYGKWEDIIMMSILEDEFFAQESEQSA